MIIEWHTHVYPPEEAAASPLWSGRCPMTVENVLAAHHKAGLAVSVVSNAAHYLRGKDAKDELRAIARWSDYAAEIQDAHQGTFYCLAMATPCGGPAHLKELERAIRELNLKGVLINSSHKGRPYIILEAKARRARPTVCVFIYLPPESRLTSR